MKKLFYLLLLPLTLLMACSDDDDISPVDMTLTLSGVSLSNDIFYTVSGEEVTIDNLTVKSIGGESTTLANVVFDLNGVSLIGTPGNPFLGTFSTENLPAGTYSLGIRGNLLQEGSSIKIFAVSFPLTIVKNADQLPSGAQDLGTFSQTIRISD